MNKLTLSITVALVDHLHCNNESCVMFDVATLSDVNRILSYVTSENSARLAEGLPSIEVRISPVAINNEYIEAVAKNCKEQDDF